MTPADENPTGGAPTVAAIAALRARHIEYLQLGQQLTELDQLPIQDYVGASEDRMNDWLQVEARRRSIRSEYMNDVGALLALVDRQARQLARAKEGLLAVGNLADIDADERVWIVRDALVEIERMGTEADDDE